MKYTLITKKTICSKKEIERKATNMLNNGTHFENMRMVEIKRVFIPVVKFKEEK